MAIKLTNEKIIEAIRKHAKQNNMTLSEATIDLVEYGLNHMSLKQSKLVDFDKTNEQYSSLANK